MKMTTATETNLKLPRLVTNLPGPNAARVVERDAAAMSPSYTRDYPLVAKRGSGAIVEDVDGNAFLDFAAGIAVCSTGHCHPQVVSAIQKQAAELIHMSGTDFYYESMPILAEGFLLQFGDGGSGRRDEAGALRYQARQDDRVLRMLSRAVDGSAFADGV
jgi:4-aminobutyrate aminotransferase-like enzyme